MNTKISLSFARFAQTILFILILSALVFVSSDAQVKGQNGGDDPLFAQNDTGIQAVVMGDGIVPGGPGFIMVSPLSFKPYMPNSPWAYYMGALLNPDPEIDGILAAGLTLPHGATITQVTLYYIDNSAENMHLVLFQGDGMGGAILMTDLLTEDAYPAYRYLSTPLIGPSIVDNQLYSYFLALQIPAGASTSLMLSNVRIDYAYNTVAPLIMK